MICKAGKTSVRTVFNPFQFSHSTALQTEVSPPGSIFTLELVSPAVCFVKIDPGARNAPTTIIHLATFTQVERSPTSAATDAAGDAGSRRRPSRIQASLEEI